jgi:hypothetical protein
LVRGVATVRFQQRRISEINTSGKVDYRKPSAPPGAAGGGEDYAAHEAGRPIAGDSDAYPELRPGLLRPIDGNLIRRQNNEVVKFATALRLGTAAAADILRRFTCADLQHPTYRALVELGKTLRTIFLCRYLRRMELLREIQEGLNGSNPGMAATTSSSTAAVAR